MRFVNLVLMQAVQDRASDIHFEPFETEFNIRYRVDGALYEMSPPPKHLALPVISRIKVMANLNISERRLPQDGRISYSAGQPSRLILRVSTLAHAIWRIGGVARSGSFRREPGNRIARFSQIRLRLRHRSDPCGPTAFSSSPARPAAAKRPRFIPACAGSTPSIPNCSPPKTRSNMTSKASCRWPSMKRSA